MLDPEALIVKGGIVILAALAMIRIILHEFNNLVKEFRRTRNDR